MASVVTVQVGQCGNQLGESLLDVLHGSCVAGHDSDSGAHDVATQVANARRRTTFFHADRAIDDEDDVAHAERREGVPSAPALTRRRARAILVDMEPRVVSACLARRSAWRYSSGSACTFQGGSGNNWARGFAQHGGEVAERVLELARREVEACDWLGGFVVLQSAAGGTGSGLGTFLTGALEDEFPGATRLNCVVWPHSSGEVVVQNYNALLTLGHLERSSHAVVNLFNDDAKRTCQRLLKIPRPEMHDLNAVFARDVAASALAPARDWGPGLAGAAAARGGDVLDATVRRVCAHRRAKFLHACSHPQMPVAAIPFSSQSWPSAVRELCQDHQRRERRDAAPYAHSRSLATILALRGRGARQCAADLSEDAQARALREALGAREVVLRSDAKPLGGLDKTVAALSNSQRIVAPLERVVAKANCMMATGAYLHQYARYGVEADDFKDKLLVLSQVVADYKTLLQE